MRWPWHRRKDNEAKAATAAKAKAEAEARLAEQRRRWPEVIRAGDKFADIVEQALRGQR